LSVSYGIHEKQKADAQRLAALYPDNAKSLQYRAEVLAIGSEVQELCKDQRG
jgi:hypothetical protein